MRKLSVFLMVLIFPFYAFADIYKCKDESGAISFSGMPCQKEQSTVYKKVEKKDNYLPSREGENLTNTRHVTAVKEQYSQDEKDCAYARSRYEKAKNNACIKGFNPVTGEIGCMGEQQRKEYIDQQKYFVDEFCG